MNEAQRQAQLAKYYRSLSFLIIDDFENFRLQIKQMIRNFGVDRIEVASTGESAVERCEYQKFDIIICDYNLGPGKNGQQVLEELRVNGLLKHTSIFVMVTAETSKDMVMGALEYLPDSYIAKPLTRAVLQRRLDRLIEQREALKPINLAIDAGKNDLAIELINEEIRAETRYVLWCLRTLANLYYHAGEYDKAQKIYLDVLSKRDIGWARLGLGRVKKALGDVNDAVDDFHQVLDDNPNIIEAYDELADAYVKLNQKKDAQITLENALKISPHAYSRQTRLAEVCIENHDIENAAEAYKTSMKLGFNSVHDKPENYLNVGKTLVELCEGDTSELGKKRAKDAIHAMDRVTRKFKDDNDVVAQAALIEARARRGQGDIDQSVSIFERAKSILEDSPLSPETQIEYAKTLYSSGETEKAETLLFKLASENADNPQVIAAINELIDEPVSLRVKLQARKLNKDGIKAFEENKLEEALESFSEALECTPKHPALNLNVIQVTLKMIRQNGASDVLVKRCNTCIQNVQHIPEQHAQFKRYQYLKDKVAAL